MQIKNPSNKAIENVQIFGVKYSIEAEGTLDNVPEVHARYWQENLHKFLILKKDRLEDKKVEDVVEIPSPKVSEPVTIEAESEEAAIEIAKEINAEKEGVSVEDVVEVKEEDKEVEAPKAKASVKPAKRVK